MNRKMNMEVEFISKDLINPSSPTPDHLRHYPLSFIDQIQSPVFLPAIMFYPKNPNLNNVEMCNILKNSLRQVLTIFYPVAGRIKSNSYVDCNDEGFLFVEAKSNYQLSDILRDKNPHNNKNLIPVSVDEAGDLGGFSQITFFSCGGFAISLGVSHKIGDALSELIFGTTWAAIARGKTNLKVPPFGWAKTFPPANESVYEPARRLILKEKITTRRFVFDASTLEFLKAKYTKNGVSPSRVTALVAFMWSRFMATSQAQEAKNKKYTVIHGVDLRSIMEPPLPKLCFGNLSWLTIAEADMEATDDESYGIVKRMKDSIGNINAEFVRKLQNSDEHLDLLKKFAQELYGEKEDFTFANLCNFPTYESTDFGWGKPLWLGVVPDIGKNLLILVDTKEGRGVEAWISLREEEMAKFECDDQLLAHVSSSAPIAQSRL